jgi:putative aldouronate transport system substrate-binding protein
MKGGTDQMTTEASPASPPGLHLSRRGFLSAAAGTAGAAAAAPLLSACGSGAATKTGSTSANELQKILPSYVPLSSGVKPDFASVNGSEPAYLSYPTTLVHTVTETPGSGGTYTAIAPDWGAIPRTAGNTYYQALNTALGANMQWQPTNGTTITTTLPTLFAGNKLPDWIDVPTWAEPPGFGQATQSKLADLTPYLTGDKIKQYPNLAAIFSNGWQQGIWNGKIVGIPTVVSGFATGVFLFYRADILDKLGIGTPSIKSLSDLYALGKEINDPKAKRWAFDDIWQFMPFPYGSLFALPSVWTTDAKGDVITTFETEEIIEAMNWEASLFKAGMIHPDAVAGNTGTAKQRFSSGQNVIVADGGGAWNVADVTSGTAANKGYKRLALDFFTASGSGTPHVGLSPPTEYVSYLNKNLKPAQIKELLRIANYLAAPFGSYEYTLVNFGAANTDYTMTSNGPVLTATGNKDVTSVVPVLLASPNNVISNPGYPDLTTASAQFVQRNAKYGYKPLFYGMNVTVPNDLTAAAAFAPFVGTGGINYIMYEVVRGRASIADYHSTVSTWLKGGGSKLKAFYETVRTKYGTA